MENNHITESELRSLANYFLEQRKTVLKRWENAAKENEQLASLAALSRKDFYNSIPDFLAQIINKLRDEKDNIEEISEEHGAQRWKLHLDLRVVLEEWRLLYSVLMQELKRAAESIPVNGETLSTAQNIISSSVYQGISQSVNRFYKSFRMEAQVRIAELEKLLSDHVEQSEIKGHSLRQASHDLGGSVALIQMNLHLLKQKELSDDTKEIVEKLSVSAENLVKMFKSLLDLFRLEAGDEKLDVSDIDVAKLMQELHENMHSLAVEKNVELRVHGSEPFHVRGDRIKVNRISQNLVMNSLKYTTEGYVEVRWKECPGNHWELCIKDTGPGLSMENTGLLNSKKKAAKANGGKKGEKLKKHVKSEGIGLLIVRRLCELLDAVVHIKSEEGEGTEFKIVFPADYTESGSPK